MVASSSDGAWIDPKWLVAAAALADFGLLLTFDVRLGLAAGALLGVALLLWAYVALRYGSLSGTPSPRAALVEGARKRENLRRMAALRSGAQQGADPAERP